MAMVMALLKRQRQRRRRRRVQQVPRNRSPLGARCLRAESIPRLAEYLRRSLAPREPWQEEEELIPVAIVMALQ